MTDEPDTDKDEEPGAEEYATLALFPEHKAVRGVNHVDAATHAARFARSSAEAEEIVRAAKLAKLRTSLASLNEFTEDHPEIKTAC